MEIKGRVALITGASLGIGKVTAELFADKGAKVALAARSVDKLTEIAKGLPGSFVVPVDMTKPEQVRRMIRDTHDHYGRLDILINNAGQGFQSPLESIDLDDFANLMALNVYGPLAAMQAVIPFMRKQGGGSIVNISSGVTKMILLNISAYAATKAALNMLSLTARKELESDGIAVSVVYPGLTDTDFRKNAVKSKAPFEPLQVDISTADSPEAVAESILRAVQEGPAEEVLGWVRDRAGR
jgi:short-subunit dehydrogenase